MTEISFNPDQRMTTGYRIEEYARQVMQAAIERRAYQKPFEFERLIELVHSREPRAILEVGTAEGGAWYAWCHAADPDAVCVSVDMAPLLGEAHATEEMLESYTLPTQTCILIRGDSSLEETRDKALAAAPDGYDFLFIDADHTLPAVTRDHELYAPLVKPGGLVAFHDILTPEPRVLPGQRPTEVDLFWDSLVKPERFWEFIDYSGPAWGGIGVYEIPADGGIAVVGERKPQESHVVRATRSHVSCAVCGLMGGEHASTCPYKPMPDIGEILAYPDGGVLISAPPARITPNGTPLE